MDDDVPTDVATSASKLSPASQKEAQRSGIFEPTKDVSTPLFPTGQDQLQQPLETLIQTDPEADAVLGAGVEAVELEAAEQKDTDQNKNAEKPKPGTNESDDDIKTCRICLSGPEDEQTCGRLIRPCKCRGTMQYVHLECLNEWRLSSAKQESFFQCDQCRYRYAFARIWWAHLAENTLVQLATTILVFLLLITLAGYVAKLLYLIFPTWLPAIPPSIAAQLENHRLRAGDHSLSDFDDSEDVVEYWLAVDFLHSMASSFTSYSIDLLHLFSGFALVAFFAFLQVSTLFIQGPRLFFGDFGGGDRAGRREGVALFVIVMVVGGVKAFWSVFKFVRRGSKRALRRLGERILEVPL